MAHGAGRTRILRRRACRSAPSGADPHRCGALVRDRCTPTSLRLCRWRVALVIWRALDKMDARPYTVVSDYENDTGIAFKATWKRSAALAGNRYARIMVRHLAEKQVLDELSPR